jgi:hypothetical protein
LERRAQTGGAIRGQEGPCFAIPAAIFELLAQELLGQRVIRLLEIRTDAEDSAVDARLRFAVKVRPVVPLASSRQSHRQALVWHYDVLRGLDYLRNAGIKPDSRVREAIKIVIERRHQNGRWPLNLLHPEHIPLEMESSVGSASRWNTLRALRVLRWYNNSTR